MYLMDDCKLLLAPLGGKTRAGDVLKGADPCGMCLSALEQIEICHVVCLVQAPAPLLHPWFDVFD